MLTRTLVCNGLVLLHLSDEDEKGAFGELIGRFEAALREHGLGLDDAVFHRFWTRDRKIRENLREARERIFNGRRRTSSSSFISRRHIVSGGSVALEMIAFKPDDPRSRRLVEFEPARGYAHYLSQDGWVFLSGMAEDAPTMDAQFDKAFTQVETALENENMNWSNVIEANLFFEQGAATADWLRNRFCRAVPSLLPRISLELVDGLASPQKKLEIEIIAAPVGRA